MRLRCTVNSAPTATARQRKRVDEIEQQMSEESEIREHLQRQIIETHQAFPGLMEKRLAEAGLHELELYLSILGTLVEKLEDEDKPLKQIAQEMFAQVAGVVMTELSS